MAAMHFGKARRGQDLVEFALILPLLLVILVGIVDFSLGFFYYNSIANAAREGARWGVIHPGDEAAIIAHARGSTIGLAQGRLVLACTLSVAGAPVACNTTNAANADTVTVTATYDYPLLTGQMVTLWGAAVPVLPLRASATMRLE